MFKYDPTISYPKETASTVVIRFQDCDPLQHLNNAKYFDYFFNAREDQVPKLYGLEIRDFIEAYRAVWVVYNHHIAYLRSANMGEWVRIMSRVVWFDTNTVVVEYYMTDRAKSHLKTLLWTTFKYVSLDSGRSVDHSQEVITYLEAVKYPNVTYGPAQFETRLKVVKEQIKHDHELNQLQDEEGAKPK